MSENQTEVMKKSNSKKPTLSKYKGRTSLDDLFAIAGQTSNIKKSKKQDGMKPVKRLRYRKLNRR